jgi:hypothetical protein
MQQQIVDYQKTATLLAWETRAGSGCDLQRWAMQKLPRLRQGHQYASEGLGPVQNSA